VPATAGAAPAAPATRRCELPHCPRARSAGTLVSCCSGRDARGARALQDARAKATGTRRVVRMTQDADGNMRVESSEHDLEDELDWFAQARVGSRCAQGRAA